MTDVIVRFDERAERDVRVAVEWYDERRSGLGSEFVETLGDTLEQVSGHPRMYPVVVPDVRRALTKRFPFSIYYEFDDGVVVVLAVLHNRRAQSTIRERTDE